MPLTGYPTSTFSILGYDPDAQEWGVAVQSKAFIVGGHVPWARAGVGAIATQAWTNKSFGPRGLALLKQGSDPRTVIQKLIALDKGGARRQLAIMDARGRTANYTGSECTPWAGGIAEPNVSVQGNILAGERVITSMLAAFHKTSGKLAARLIAALEAGQRAGGDTRGQQAAALLVVRAYSDINTLGDIYVDLRVDDHKTPIAELRRLYGVWEKELYPYLEGNAVARLLHARKYARAQRLHRQFLAHAERLARKHPRDAELMNSIAWQLARHSLALDAALKYAQRAVRLSPDDPNITDTLAEVWLARGEPDRAVAIERELVASHPANAEFARRLAKFEKASRRAARA